MKNKDKVPYVVVFCLGCISMLVIAATTVQPGKPISQYPRASTFEGTDIFIIARTNVSPATNLGVTGLILSNFVATISTNLIRITPGGTNVVITTNVSGGVVTYTITITNIGSGSDVVWTNDGTLVYTLPSGSIATNTIQIYTNGGLSLGKSTRAYWGIQPGSGGESMISVRNTSNGETDFNEWSIVSTDGTNAVFQDYFLQASLNRRWMTMNSPTTGKTEIDEFVEDDGDVMFRAWDGTNGGFRWRFQPGISTPSYLFNSYDIITPSSPIFVFQNATTNKLTGYGDGDLDVAGQITNQFLTASKLVLTDTGKGLVSSAFGETNLQQFATTNYVNNAITNISGGGGGDSVWTNSAGVVTIVPTSGQASTNVIIQTNGYTTIAGQITNHFLFTNKFVMTDVGKGLVSSSIGEDDLGFFATTNYVNCAITSHVATLTGTTNFINLSVQAAKLPGNDNPAVGSGYKNWELVYYKTNNLGIITNLSANWQFVVPPDYATNSLQLYFQQMILQTNGVSTSNTIFSASIWKSTPGDSVDVHTNEMYGAGVSVTNEWAASTSGTNRLQTSLISFGTNAPIQAGDFAVLRLSRGATNDTYRWEAAVVGMQLWYTRP